MSTGRWKYFVVVFLPMAMMVLQAVALPDKGPNPASNNKVVYGIDNRIDVYAETNTTRRSWAASTCGLVFSGALTQQEDGSYTLATNEYRWSGLPPCPEEPFGDQRTAPHCSGFQVGSDIIATAGHCLDERDLASTRFVFGFQMANASDMVTTLEASQVYAGVEILGRRLQGDYDYTVVRVDRPIEAPGARTLPIRRAAVVPLGNRVGVIGHPSGLPLKIAFGDNTVVRDNSNDGFFVANLDTFGGNSGSPVFNAETGVVEGILVRGEVDFVRQGSCFISNQVPDTGGRGEDVSTTLSFADFVPPEGSGTMFLDRQVYPCGSVVTVTVADADIQNTGTVPITISTNSGDLETLHLSEIDGQGTFTGTIALAQGSVTQGNGRVEAGHGQTLTATYADASGVRGNPATITTSADVDCVAPEVMDASLAIIGGSSVTVAIQTDEITTAMVHVGSACGASDFNAMGGPGVTHTVRVGGLAPERDYFLYAVVEDEAGNSTLVNNGGSCFPFTTASQTNYFTQNFFNTLIDLEGLSVTFTPDSASNGYSACTAAAFEFPADPNCGTAYNLADDSYLQVGIEDGKTFPFFGGLYDAFFVGSNGYVTFGRGDDNYEGSLEAHFFMPRISGAFTDLVPSRATPVVVRQWDDRISVTYEDMPTFFGQIQSFQIEMFFDGDIRLTWLRLSAPIAAIGLSAGGGIPPDFQPSDLSAYADCVTNRPVTDCAGAPLVTPQCHGGTGASSGGHGLRGDLLVVLLALTALMGLPRGKVALKRAPATSVPHSRAQG